MRTAQYCGLRGPLARRPTDRLPGNQRLPPAYRLGPEHGGEPTPYGQPLTRADIEAVRGVHCGDLLRLLMEKGLIRITGRHDSLGRPVLYGTTKKFLQVFGLKSLKDLPQAEGLSPPTEGTTETPNPPSVKPTSDE